MEPKYPAIPCGFESLVSPLVPNENAFNPCFVTMVVSLTLLGYLVAGALVLFRTLRTPRFGNYLPKSTGLWHSCRVAFVLLHTLTLFYLGSFLDIHERFADAKMNAYLIWIMCSGSVIVPLHFLESCHFPVPSDLLISYWPVVTVIELILVFQDTHTNWIIFKSRDSPGTVYTAEVSLIIMSIAIFILEYGFWTPSHELIHEYVSKGKKYELEKPNIIDKLTFTWMNGMIMKSYHTQTIEQVDLPNSPAKLSTEVAANRLMKFWDAKDSSKHIPEAERNNASLLVSLIKAFGLLILYSFFFEFGSKVLTFVQPQLLRIFIQHFDEKNPLILKGFLISLSMFLLTMFQTFVYNQYVLINLEVGLNVRSSITALIYKKALKLSSAARQKASSGDIINFMSVDVNRIQTVVMDLSVLVLAPFDLILCIVSLWPLLGKSTLAGICVMSLLIPVNTFLVRYVRRLNKTQMKLKDARTNIVNEIMVNIKSIKLLNWESAMLRKLSHARNDKELKNMKRIRLLNQVAGFVWILIPFLVSFTTFTTFSLIETIPLTSDIVFPALALLNLLSSPLLALPQFVNTLVEASVSITRIRDFLLMDEIDNKVIKFVPKTENPGDVSVKVKDVDFLWSEYNPETSDNQYALRGVNFEARKGEISCLVGRVGSGKSAMLYGLLGQLVIKASGKDPLQNASKSGPASPIIQLHGSIAYCAQQPWIMNASVKENVLFGHRYDEEFYNKTIEACQLSPDIKILPDGDNTQVGEKGVSLSGGQKARLALARAVYSRSDIYLLDDILSAVDSHVGKNIINQVLSSTGLLATKTIILCTNSISDLKYAAKITFIQKGKIIEESKYQDINLDAHPELFQLLKEFDRGDSNISDGENEESKNASPAPEQKLLTEAPGTSDSETLSISADTRSLRRASIETFKWEPLKRLLPNLRSGPSNEISAKGKVKWSVYLEYARACSIPGIIGYFFLLVIAALLSVGGNYWLKHWTEENSKAKENNEVWKFITVYALFGFGSSFMSIIKGMVLMLRLAVNASIKIHNDMANRIIRAPMSFFERTPVGRIMNRFTNDIVKIDSALPYTISSFTGQSVNTLLTFIIIGIAMPLYIIIISILSVLYIYYEIFYVAISRELKRLVSISKSPIYAHLGESLNGLDTIRAFRQTERFDFINNSNTDFNLKSVYMLRSINRWLFFRLQVIGSIGIWTASTLAIYTLSTASPLTSSMAGFIMTYALQVTSSLKVIVRLSAEVETSIVAVERCIEYSKLTVEEDEDTLKRMHKPPLTWPMDGAIQFNKYSTKYRENLDLILRNVSFSIKAGEKIGIVGRTGAGKSSLALAIFRIIEAVEGSISIDGLKTSAMPLSDLRSNLSIIPQDSQLIEGTIRQNLDPFDYYTDEEIWKALELAHLKEHISSLDFENNNTDEQEDVKMNEGEERSKLQCLVKESGSNFSSGQRQLMSLARVLLRMKDSKILVLDEATAAVDVQTDKIIQETIRAELKDKTIITIAHRLETVMDSDKIVTLDHGELKEFDSPQNLLKNPDGIFYSLCAQGGYI